MFCEYCSLPSRKVLMTETAKAKMPRILMHHCNSGNKSCQGKRCLTSLILEQLTKAGTNERTDTRKVLEDYWDDTRAAV